MENNSTYPIIMAIQGKQANANANIPNLYKKNIKWILVIGSIYLKKKLLFYQKEIIAIDCIYYYYDWRSIFLNDWIMIANLFNLPVCFCHVSQMLKMGHDVIPFYCQCQPLHWLLAMHFHQPKQYIQPYDHDRVIQPEITKKKYVVNIQIFKTKIRTFLFIHTYFAFLCIHIPYANRMIIGTRCKYCTIWMDPNHTNPFTVSNIWFYTVSVVRCRKC